MLEKEVKNKIRKIYIKRNFEEREKNIIIEFVINFQKTFGDKYIVRILKRLEDLEDIKKQFNDSKYQASSKKNYIIFYKNIINDTEFKYILEHELFHFIQKEGSKFEEIPSIYKNIIDKNIKIFLLEEAFVQYFTACINKKVPEYTLEDNKGNKRKYWLNECYKQIVGKVEELEEKIGRKALIDMYMEDGLYEEEIKKFDNKYGENAFGEYIKEICS